MSGKRKDYISWDEYFMGVAVLSGMRSKDPNTQVGACIVSEDHKILSMGYNGFPTGCSDDEFPWEREEAWRAQRSMLRCFPAMNVQKRSFSRESAGSCMTATNMRQHRQLWHPKRC